LTRTPLHYIRNVLFQPSSALNVNVAKAVVLMRNGNLFSGCASSLNTFSSYRVARGCPAMPCQTTGTLEAPTLCSSRTERALPSDTEHPQ